MMRHRPFVLAFARAQAEKAQAAKRQAVRDRKDLERLVADRARCQYRIRASFARDVGAVVSDARPRW